MCVADLEDEKTLRKHFRAEISIHHVDRLLLLCCLVSGLMDSTIYQGEIFTANGLMNVVLSNAVCLPSLWGFCVNANW